MKGQLSDTELLQLMKRLESMDKIDHTNDNTITNDTNGSIDGWVKVENTQIVISEPSDGGQYPAIQSVAPVKLKCNGAYLTDKYTLEANDVIEYEIEDCPLFRIEISTDKMNAYLQVNSVNRYAWKLKDQEPSLELVIEAEEDPDNILEQLSLFDITATVENMKVIKYVVTNEIYNEIQNPTARPLLIASGVEPTPSQDATLELFFAEKVENQLTERDGTVDFRDHLKIPHVNKGDVIAKKHAPIAGTAGYDVYGTVISPPKPKDIAVAIKENVLLTQGGLIVALKEGRPRMTGFAVKYFDICTSFIVEGDVDIKTGNIIFSGDVIVYGNVTEGMVIESLGNVYVGGNVYHATITATGSINVQGNIFKSELYSGYFGVIFNHLYMNIKRMNQMLNSITTAVSQMVSILHTNGKTVGFKMVLLTVIENKFHEILKVSKDIIFYTDSIQGEYKNEFSILKDEVIKFSSIERVGRVTSLKEIEMISTMLLKVFKMIEGLQETEVQIDFSQSNLSNVKSTGDILIRGKGTLQSDLYAGKNIVFYDNDAVCRGGQLESGDTISAMTIGGETGGETQLKAGKKIMFTRMNSGRLCVDQYWKHVIEPINYSVITIKDHRMVISPQ